MANAGSKTTTKKQNNDVDDGNSSATTSKHDIADQNSLPTNGSSEIKNNTKNNKELTTVGRILVFVVFPLTMGVIGLYVAYLDQRRHPNKQLSFDQDFMVPFLLALTMSVVIGFQTSGFSTSVFKPLVPWPKVRRVKKKIIQKKKKDKETNMNLATADTGEDKRTENATDKKND